jgi:phospholipase/carboxylesterase
MTPSLVFHQFIPGTGVPLMLLHGSGGNEQDLIPLAVEFAPGTSALAIRGTVEIDGGFAFFHRRPDRSIDEADLGARIPPLAAFVEAASAEYDFAKPPVVIGFSNGAIMAAALLLTQPALFSAGILFRPLSPFFEDRPDRLGAKPVLIIDGEKDSRRSPGDGAMLAKRLTRAGAIVTHHLLPVGHAITEQDRRIARDWLREL